MASQQQSERKDDSPDRAINLPLKWDQRRAQNDHAREDDPRQEPREPEALEDLGDFLEEIRPLNFFLCCAPRHVVREAVGQDRLRDRDRESAEEEEAGGRGQR